VTVAGNGSKNNNTSIIKSIRTIRPIIGLDPVIMEMLMTEDTGIEEMEFSTDANPTVPGWAPPPEIDENA